MIHDFLGVTPRRDETNFIAPSADVIGDVTLGREASIWFGAVVRGDVNWIEIGAGSNVQDNATVHVTNGTAPTRIGRHVTVGHNAVVHGCNVQDRVLVGMNAVVMDHAVIGHDSIVGAGALVTARTEVPPHSLVLGSPARVVRRLTDAEVESVQVYAEHYLHYSRIYRGEETPARNPFYERER